MVIVKATQRGWTVHRPDGHHARMDGIPSNRVIGTRLRTARLALGYKTQTRFAAASGLGQTRYNQYEKGERFLTLSAAIQICERHGVTLDWLYCGRRWTLPEMIAKAIADSPEPSSELDDGKPPPKTDRKGLPDVIRDPSRLPELGKRSSKSLKKKGTTHTAIGRKKIVKK